MTKVHFVAVNTVEEMEAVINAIMMPPKDPNQLPPGPARDVGKHEETEFDEDQDDADDEDELETPDDDTADFD